MNDFDPQAPFVAQDGLEYEDLAAKILGNPIDSWRNAEILTRRASGHDEASIRRWIKAYDGDDYIPGECSSLSRQVRGAAADSNFLGALRQVRAKAATGGYDLIF